MKTSFKVAAIFIMGYLFGWLLPPWHIVPEGSQMTQTETYKTIIGILGMVGTIGAVVVALFQNEIRSWFKSVGLEAKLHSEGFNEDVEDVKEVKRATRYYNELEISNKGNLNALNCELYIESARITYNNNSNRQLHFSNDQLLGANSGKEIYIPSEGKKIIPLFEILRPEEQSTPDGSSESTLPKLKILGIEDLNGANGKVQVDYCIYAVNSRPLRFKFTLDWTGAWEQRKEEMKNLLKLKIERK